MSQEVKTVPVQEPVLRGFEGAVKALNKAVEDAIRGIDPEAETAPVFDRSDPIESAVSLLKTADQNVGVLKKLAEKSKDEAERAGAIAERMAKAVEAQAKGMVPCKTCKTAGKLAKGECGDCDGNGFVEAKSAA